MRLADFKGEDKSFDIMADAMPLVMKLKFNPATVEWLKAYRERDKEKRDKDASSFAFVYYAEMIKNDKESAIELFALLNEKTPEDYRKEINAGTLLRDMYSAFIHDDDLMVLFDLRLPKTSESSGEPTENIEDAEK